MSFELLLCVHCLASCDSYHVVDIVYRATTRKVVHWTGNTLKNWTNSDSIAKTLNKLVADIANLKVRNDKHIGMTSNKATWCLLLAYSRNKSCIGLQFTIELKLRSHLVCKTCSLNHLVYYLMLG